MDALKLHMVSTKAVWVLKYQGIHTGFINITMLNIQNKFIYLRNKLMKW